MRPDACAPRLAVCVALLLAASGAIADDIPALPPAPPAPCDSDYWEKGQVMTMLVKKRVDAPVGLALTQFVALVEEIGPRYHVALEKVDEPGRHVRLIGLPPPGSPPLPAGSVVMDAQFEPMGTGAALELKVVLDHGVQEHPAMTREALCWFADGAGYPVRPKRKP